MVDIPPAPPAPPPPRAVEWNEKLVGILGLLFCAGVIVYLLRYGRPESRLDETQATVRLYRVGSNACAEIEDDGVGLPAEPGSPPGHMGLFNMRERAALLGGTCTFARGAAGGGTIVRACLPVDDGTTPEPRGQGDST